ncbi:MAG: hypothetical protein ACLS5R_03970 [Blautia sp.]
MAVHTLENDRLTITIDDHGAELSRIFDKKTTGTYSGRRTQILKRHAPILFPNVSHHYGPTTAKGVTYPSQAHGFARVRISPGF